MAEVGGYVDARALLAEALQAFLPPEPIGVAEWAGKYRWLTNEGGGHVGLWDNERAPYLVEPMEALTSERYLTVAVAGPGQSGKALALDTLLATPDGWTTMGDVSIGDELFGANGRPCRVTFTTPVQAGRPCYRVRFSDGAEIVADQDHRWEVCFPGVNFCDPERREVRTTGEMLADAVSSRRIGMRETVRNRYSIPLPAPLEMRERGLPVDPYLLGLWLGDGHSFAGRLTLHEDDDEIFEHVREAGYRAITAVRTATGVLTVDIRTPDDCDDMCSRGHQYAETGRRAWGACSECGRQDAMHHKYSRPRDEPRARDSFTRRLKLLGIFPGKKAIPAIYQRASQSQRLALLQGLLDTDGSADDRGRAEYSTVLPALADGFRELVAGLGLKSSVSCRKVFAVVNGERRPGQDSYRFAVPIPAGLTVFRLTRKQRRLDTAARPKAKQTSRRKIVAIEPVASVQVRCIQVDSPGHLFLAGREMVPTHNTSIGDNWMLQSIDADPANMLRYMQTKDAVEAYVKRTVDPMLAAHEQVKAKQGLRPIDDSLGFKRFRGMSVDFLVAARSNLISKDAPRIIADEIDAWDPGFGDPMVQLDVRRSTYGSDSMVLAVSHPDRARGVEPSDWIAGIMAVYCDSTRCTWWWPCPECNAFISPNPGAARQCVLVYPEDAPLEEIAAQTFLLCPCCGALIRDDQRAEMNRRGCWVGQGEEIDEAGVVTGSRVRSSTAGYWIVGMMSPFLLEGIGGLARNRVKAERERDASGEDRTLREVMTKQWGIPYQPTRQVGSLDAETLADRAEPGLHIGLVPEGVRFLTAAIDCQNDRFEAMVRGWGVDGESWIVAHWIVRADPATSPGDWDDLIRDVLARRWLLADGSGRTMRVFAAGYDSQGQAGVTAQAFLAWQRAQALGYAKRAGIVDGREAWTLLPLRGASGNNPAPIVVTRPDSQWRKDRATSTRGVVPLGIFAPNRFKDDAAMHLSVAAPGPWHIHIPTGFRGDYPAEPRRDAKPHLFFEQLTAERRNARGAWAKLTSASRNEAWDLLVMTHVMAHLHGLVRLNWNNPPGWAATWDENPFVEPGDGDDPPRPQGKGSAPGPARAVPAAPARRVIRSNFMRR